MLGVKKTSLVVQVQGACSAPIPELLGALQVVFEELGFQVIVEVPDEFPEAWDGFVESETVLIKYGGDI